MFDKKLWSKQYHEKNREKRLEEQRKRRRKTIKWFRSFKEKLECFYCDENSPVCLDFHHVDSSIKESNIGRMATQGQARARILKEISKCDVLCKNCHAKLHVGVL